MCKKVEQNVQCSSIENVVNRPVNDRNASGMQWDFVFLSAGRGKKLHTHTQMVG